MLPIKIDLSKHKRGAKWTTKCLRTWGRNRTRRRIRDSLWQVRTSWSWAWRKLKRRHWNRKWQWDRIWIWIL